MKKIYSMALLAFLGIVAWGNTGSAQIIWRRPRPVLPPPPPPVVNIVTPEDGAAFLAPADIEIYAEAVHFTDTVSSVEFLAGTNSLGVVTNGIVIPWLAGRSPAYFGFAWSNAPAGSYSLTAVATD